jgi:1-deoxy-D-xylulose-5-phosphate synthase
LTVVFCLDRGGLVGEDGPTHHGVFDLSFFRCVPNLTVAAPMDEHQLRNLMYTAQLPNKGAFAIRYPRGKGNLSDWCNPMQELPIGKGEMLKSGEKIAFVTIGEIGNRVKEAITLLQHSGINAGHFNMIFLKPIDEALLHEVAQNYPYIVTVEEGTIVGGLGSAVLEFLSDQGYSNRVKRIGIPDQFIEHGDIESLRDLCGLSVEKIAQTTQSFLNH